MRLHNEEDLLKKSNTFFADTYFLEKSNEKNWFDFLGIFICSLIFKAETFSFFFWILNFFNDYFFDYVTFFKGDKLYTEKSDYFLKLN